MSQQASAKARCDMKERVRLRTNCSRYFGVIVTTILILAASVNSRCLNAWAEDEISSRVTAESLDGRENTGLSLDLQIEPELSAF